MADASHASTTCLDQKTRQDATSIAKRFLTDVMALFRGEERASRSCAVYPALAFQDWAMIASDKVARQSRKKSDTKVVRAIHCARAQPRLSSVSRVPRGPNAV